MATTRSERFYAEVWPHATVVLRTARILVGDANEADDLAQETMVKAFEHLDKFRAGTDAKAWLLAILRNTRIDRLRSRGSRASDVSLDAMTVEPAEPADSPEAPHDPALWANPRGLLEQFSDGQVIAALQALPEDIRWTILLVDVERLDQAEAAGILGVPVGTVKSRCHRGREMLKAGLSSLAREMRVILD